MIKLNDRSTRLFAQLLEKLDGSEHLRIQNEGFMPLVLEQVGSDISTEEGNAHVYSLAHYSEMNGDAIRDPEMCFLVIDQRSEPTDYFRLKIFPTYFLMDIPPVEQHSITMEDGRVTVCNLFLQHQHAEFANIWLSNISDQGFLELPGRRSGAAGD